MSATLINIWQCKLPDVCVDWKLSGRIISVSTIQYVKLVDEFFLLLVSTCM